MLKSLGDIASCLLGFLVARRLLVRYAVALILVIALALLFVYRDNLAAQRDYVRGHQVMADGTLREQRSQSRSPA